MRNRVRGPNVEPLRCPRCRLHLDLCACGILVPRMTATEVIVVAHRFEVRKTTNTGQIAVHCLANARLCVRGHENGVDDPVAWSSERTPLLLFPAPDAIPLDEWKMANAERAQRTTLIVPDGTWRQAKRVRRRVPGLAEIQAVCLPPTTSSYRLRQARGASQLATMEAVARALGILDGAEIETHLLYAFHAVIGRALWSNGRVDTQNVVGGIPSGARRDGPRLTGS